MNNLLFINTDALLAQLKYDPENPLLFNHGLFVYFFSLFIFLYYAFRNNIPVRRYIFCFFSLYFFYKASGSFVLLVILSAIVDFLLSNAIYKQTKKSNKKLLLLVSILFNLGLLFWFKYTNFFIAFTNDFFKAGISPLNILLPVGISFYTFENLSYTIDVYRGEFKPADKFSDYLLFLSFFPKLVMGPIVRANDFVPQINKPWVVSNEQYIKGFLLIVTGMFKKIIISDYLTLNYVNFIFDDPSRYTGLENLFAVYAYAAVIYCDFSGYSDVALGIASWLGFSIPVNFLSPYQSTSITDFWRRWHISLSSWLKDYLYIPLGGNRNTGVAGWILFILFFGGLLFALQKMFLLSFLLSVSICLSVLFVFAIPAIVEKKKAPFSTNINLLSTMIVGGFWHGASWNFIGWGILHGVALAVHKVWKLFTDKSLSAIKKNKAYTILAAVFTFHFVCFCWIFFKAETFEGALVMIRRIFFDLDFVYWKQFFGNYKTVLGMLFLAICTHLLPDSLLHKTAARYQRIPMVYFLLIYFLFILLYGYFKSAEQVLPIYLQF